MEKERERMENGRVSDEELERDTEEHFRINIVNERHFNGFHRQPKWLKKAFHAILPCFVERVFARMYVKGGSLNKRIQVCGIFSLLYMKQADCGSLPRPH